MSKDKKPTKLKLNKETVKNLKTKSNLKAGAPMSGAHCSDGCISNGDVC
jgi:hypothetical protein